MVVCYIKKVCIVGLRYKTIHSTLNLHRFLPVVIPDLDLGHMEIQCY
jgi:hypothetical protein